MADSTLEIPEVEEPQAEEKATTEEEAQPPKEQPPVVPLARFNEVYAQWRNKEREAASLEARLAAVEQRLQSASQQEEEPDPAEDASAWKAWYARQQTKAPPAPSSPPPQPQAPQVDETLIEMARMVWPDYDQVVNSQLARLQADPAAQQRIMASKNPPAEVYRWAKSQVDQREHAKENMAFERGLLEGDEFFENDGGLAPEEKKMAEQFGMTEKESRIREMEAAKKEEKKASTKKRATKPWQDNRWKRDLLKVDRKPVDKYCYWVPQSKIQDFLNRGWSFAHVKDYGGVGDKIVGEESNHGTRVIRRELVLMEQPKKWREEFEEYRAYIRRSQFERGQTDATKGGLYPVDTPPAGVSENLTPEENKEE